jgi:uncharacterized protein (UPF0332 family)
MSEIETLLERAAKYLGSAELLFKNKELCGS